MRSSLAIHPAGRAFFHHYKQNRASQLALRSPKIMKSKRHIKETIREISLIRELSKEHIRDLNSASVEGTIEALNELGLIQLEIALRNIFQKESSLGKNLIEQIRAKFSDHPDIQIVTTCYTPEQLAIWTGDPTYFQIRQDVQP